MKLKDLFTLGNLLSGYAAVLALFVIPDMRLALQWACYLIFIGWAFDSLDGPIARLTKQFDTFGGVFDSVCDYVTNSLAPSFILFFAYWKVGDYPWWVGALVGGFPLTLGTIRQAKQQDKPQTYPCYWIGLPRPVLTIFILAMLNSSAFILLANSGGVQKHLGYGILAFITVGGSFLHLSTLPFANHHGRRWMQFLRFGAHMFRTVVGPVFLFGWLVLDWPWIVFDYFLWCLLIYIFLSWTQITREDLRRYRLYLKTGELIKPLVHRDETWQTKTWAPFFLEKDAGREESTPASAPQRDDEPEAVTA